MNEVLSLGQEVDQYLQDHMRNLRRRQLADMEKVALNQHLNGRASVFGCSTHLLVRGALI